MARAPDHSVATFTETNGTLTATTATVAANVNRRGIIVSNNSDTVMTLSVGGTASASVGIAIPAGTAIKLEGTHTPSAALTLYCAGTSKAYSIYEW